MAETPVIVTHTRLHGFIVDVLIAMKMDRTAAETTAGHMVQTDLRGVDSHGIGMLPRYVEWWREGYLRLEHEPRVVRDDGAMALFDSGQCLGHYVATLAMRTAIAKARAYGIGIATVRNSSHFGAAANYSMMALEHEMIGLATTNMPVPAAVPTFGRKGMLSTNPISFAAPAGRHAPFVLDMATTTVAIGKLVVASRWGKPIPEGWALDDRGRPTTDPVVALRHRLLSPLGGSRELGGHKGYGLGVMVDILSGVLNGAVYGNLFERSDMKERKVQNAGHCLAAIDPSRFRPIEEFKRDMDDMLEALKTAPRAEGQERIYVAGEPEFESERRRRKDGLPLAPVLVAQCNAIARDLGSPRWLEASGRCSGPRHRHTQVGDRDREQQHEPVDPRDPPERVRRVLALDERATESRHQREVALCGESHGPEDQHELPRQEEPGPALHHALEGPEPRHVVKPRQGDHGDRGPRDGPPAPGGHGEDAGPAAPGRGAENVGLVREPADPGDDAQHVEPHRDEPHYWSGGRGTGPIGGWPETRRDPAPFRMSRLIPPSAAGPAPSVGGVRRVRCGAVPRSW